MLKKKKERNSDNILRASAHVLSNIKPSSKHHNNDELFYMILSAIMSQQLAPLNKDHVC